MANDNAEYLIVVQRKTVDAPYWKIVSEEHNEFECAERTMKRMIKANRKKGKTSFEYRLATYKLNSIEEHYYDKG